MGNLDFWLDVGLCESKSNIHGHFLFVYFFKITKGSHPSGLLTGGLAINQFRSEGSSCHWLIF